MKNEIIEAEIVPDDKLVKYASETGLEKPATETLVHAFAPVFAKSRSVLADAAGVAASVKDATCVTEIRKSRTCRLAIRAVRLEGEAVHKKQKESALRFGRAVDGFRNILLADLAPVEQALQEAEDTAERAEAARKLALKRDRTVWLMPFLDGPLLLDLGELSETAWAKVYDDAKLLRQAKIDAAVKAEAERLAKEKAEREERERIAAENARLKEEAIARDAAARVERDAAERAIREAAAKAREERAAAEKKLAAERAAAERAIRDAAAKARAEREAAEKKLADEREAARVAAAAAAEIAARKLGQEREAAAAQIKIATEKARVEREAIEAKAREEQRAAKERHDKLEAELAARFQEQAAANAKADAEAKAAALAARKAAAAPDRAKLLAFTTEIRAVPIPFFADETINGELLAEVTRLVRWINDKAQGLS